MDSAFWRVIKAIRNKIYMTIGKGKLDLVNNSTGKKMLVQITGLNGEVITEAEMPQNYGFASNPVPGNVEVSFVAIDGNRDMTIVLKAHDRDNHPTDLAPGDVRVYDKNGNAVKLGLTGISLKTGDAAIWQPNILTVDPITGVPHGGITAGIVKLKGE